jgi:hypothetical protein
MKQTEMTIRPGTRLAVDVLARDGRSAGITVEIRYTAEQEFKLFAHSVELCNGPEGCQPLIHCEIVTADEAMVRAKADPDGYANSDDFIEPSLTEMLAEIFGDNVYTVDEHGYFHPLKPKKNN